VHGNVVADGIPYRGHQVGDEIRSGQQWLAAMQDEPDFAEGMATDVLTDADCGLLGNFR
jgi:hypothetical protein